MDDRAKLCRPGGSQAVRLPEEAPVRRPERSRIPPEGKRPTDLRCPFAVARSARWRWVTTGERNLAAASGGGIDWTRPIRAERQGLKRATYEDALSAPEHKVAEILDGELFLSPRPAPRHSVACSELYGALVPFGDGHDGPGGWRILFEPELPDVAFFTLEVLRLRDGAWTIVAVCSGSDSVRIEPFDAIELALRRLWVD